VIGIYGENNMPYVYILKCADGSYYTGSTWNLNKRLWEHENGLGANYTRKRRPLELVYCEECERVEDAFWREKQIQSWSRRKKEALMAGDWKELAAAAKSRSSASTGSAAGVDLASTGSAAGVDLASTGSAAGVGLASTGSAAGVGLVADVLQQANQYNLHGLLFQHIELCETRVWLHYHKIDCAHLNRHMQAGLLVHETHYGGEAAQALFGFGIQPDRVDFKRREVSEVKKSKSHEGAAIGQLRFYLALLERATGEAWTGVLRYPQSRRTKKVVLDEAGRAELGRAAGRIVEIIGLAVPPERIKKPLCGDCSYRMVCWQESTEDGDF
jgi:predicted GIY-YIG superfamily endonuclease/CRISPR/Cas system-associated exonuclease Cas4 (RecB family)